MKNDLHLVTNGWEDYQLLDSGDGMKLERFGEVITARPETQALWQKQKPELWKQAQAVFEFAEKKGEWKTKRSVPESWQMKRGPLTFTAKLSGFKHTGIFPEQEPNWIWVKDRVKALGTPEVLNLFGYTGIATLAAAHPGAQVTHVDASKQSLDWAHANARLSEIPEDRIRWILDDALAFAKREARRGTKYDGIILDPPAFGRGAKGEVWHIEKDLPSLLSVLKGLLKDAPGSFLLINGYAAGYAPRAFSQALESAFGDVEGESGELHIQEASTDRVIPSGIYTRFVR
jgi:23S rRNA (cytosine1962-C5)-methyltransferase